MPRQIGLENLTVALVEKDVAGEIVYATPLKLERSIKAKISPKTSSEKLYSDDSVEEILNNFDSCDVEIELNQLQLASRALIQGAKIINGLLVENKDDIAPELALGFRSKKSNGKYRYVWLLKGKFEITEDEYETIGEKPTAQSNSLSGSFYGRNSDGNWRIMEDEDSENANPERIANWFKGVPPITVIEKNPEENNSENPEENNTENNPENPEENNIENNPENPEENNTENNPENPEENNTENTPENPEENNTENNPENPEENNAENNPENPDEPEG